MKNCDNNNTKENKLNDLIYGRENYIKRLVYERRNSQDVAGGGGCDD